MTFVLNVPYHYLRLSAAGEVDGGGVTGGKAANRWNLGSTEIKHSIVTRKKWKSEPKICKVFTFLWFFRNILR